MGSISISGSGGSGSITINTTPIVGGTPPRVLFDNGATVGEAANFNISSGQPSVPVGSAYLYGTDLIAYGVPAHQSWFYGNAGNTSTTGLGNTGIGDLALLSLTSGLGNTAFGVNAMKANTTGSGNLAVGNGAIQADTAPTNCVAIGAAALGAGGPGNGSVFAIGDHSCNLMAGGTGIVAIGANALLNTVLVSETIAIGGSAMSINNATGVKNVCIGSSTGQRITTGSSNIFIGFGTGSFITSGDKNTIIGHDSGGSVTTGRANTIIGNAAGAANSQNCIILAEGDGLTLADANFTNANKWTIGSAAGGFITGLVLPWITTQGVLVSDTSGNVTCDSSSAAATVTANFTADHRLQITIGGTTFYIAMSTTPW